MEVSSDTTNDVQEYDVAMAEITAAMVKELREKTDLPMMDCKKALNETGGDMNAAIDLLRKKGAAAAEKKAGRETAEGRVAVHVDREKGVGAIAEVLCETAPTSNNPVFQEMVAKIARHAALSGTTDPEAILDEKFVDDPGMTIRDIMTEVINKIRENMKINRLVRAEGRLGHYVHHDGRVAVLLQVEGEGEDAVLADLCMHITAMMPRALDRQSIPAEDVAREKEIVREQIIASGKPENLVEKISEGKMNRWFSERVLLEQPFVKDDKKSVGDVAKEAGFKLTGFTRLKVGQP